jgi:hypothetical protein
LDGRKSYIPDEALKIAVVRPAKHDYAATRYTFRIQEPENLWEYYFALFQRLKLYANPAFQAAYAVSSYKVGVKRKRLKAGWDNNYLIKLIKN